MIKALHAKKREMSQVFTPEGNVIPVTIIEAAPNFVSMVKTAEGSDGYNAYQIAGEEIREKVTPKPELGHLKKAGVPAMRRLREVRFEGAPQLEAGAKLTVESFAVGDLIDIIGTSKGRGFQGGVRRHNFNVGRRSHGGKMIRHGSTGSNTTPGRVRKGKRMPGHMGVERTTTRNLEVVRIDAEKNLIYVKGAVPGHRNGDIFIRGAITGSRRKGALGAKK